MIIKSKSFSKINLQFYQISRFTSSDAYHFNFFGPPSKVLKFGTVSLKSQANFDILFSPINPSDINMIEGKYPIEHPSSPQVAGNECLGYFHGKSGKRLAVAARANLGTWRKKTNVDETDLLILPRHFKPNPLLAMITVNPFTAYRLLKDFADLKKGDVVIQNAANSVVGRCVIQLAKIFGFRTLNIVRERKDIAKTKKSLKEIGADVVVTDTEITETQKSFLKTHNLPKAKVALNAVGGRIVNTMARLLEDGSSLVTYGAMSRNPVTVSASSQIFRDIKFAGFWVTRWHRTATLKERMDVLEELYGYIESKKLAFPYKKVSFGDTKAVMDAIENPPKDRKAVISME